jgi:hypothetical protein
MYFVCVQNSDNKSGLNARTVTRTKMADRFQRDSGLGPVFRTEAVRCGRHHHTLWDRCVHRPRGGGHLLHCGLPALAPAIWLALLHVVITRRSTAVAAFYGLAPELSWGTFDRFRGFQYVHKHDINVNFASTSKKIVYPSCDRTVTVPQGLSQLQTKSNIGLVTVHRHSTWVG